MKSNSNIFSKWNIKFSGSIRNRYTHPKIIGVKPHSVFTVLAVVLINLIPFIFLKGIPFGNKYYQIFALAYKAVYILYTILICGYALYCWKVFLSLRREGINTDKNLFFSESAGFYRKLLFYLALVPWFIMKMRSHLYPENMAQQMNRLRHQLHSDFYHEAGKTVLESIILSILIVELSRLLFPKTFSWSYRTHTAVVIVTSLAMSALRVAALNFASRHGII